MVESYRIDCQFWRAKRIKLYIQLILIYKDL